MFLKVQYHIGICFALLVCFLAAGEIPEGLKRLLAAYPATLIEVKGSNTLVWKDGTEMVYDDGIVKKNYEDLLNHASLKDQMMMPYTIEWPPRVPETNQDPGRVRCEAFFKKMYGHSEQEVRKNLVPVVWYGKKTLLFNKRSNAADALARVYIAIQQLPPETQIYVRQPIGTFCWRSIAGETRLSMHSYGIAIDFKLPDGKTRYWRDHVKTDTDHPLYPVEILKDERLGVLVGIFEKNGFIWGGKWSHYDTMHFEYRPELVVQKNGNNAVTYNDLWGSSAFPLALLHKRIPILPNGIVRNILWRSENGGEEKTIRR